MKPIIFLDIDGVLNGHEFDHGAQSCTIRPDCVKRFNRILSETGAVVVLHSAWRYMILGGAMTLSGFRYMLQTHGVAGCDLIGHTVSDEVTPDRADQIKDWLALHPEVTHWVVLDDLEVPVERIVQTQGLVGLTDADVDRAIALLREGAHEPLMLAGGTHAL